MWKKNPVNKIYVVFILRDAIVYFFESLLHLITKFRISDGMFRRDFLKGHTYVHIIRHFR